MPKDKNYLKNLTISELSLVDNPANEDSRVTLFKRKTPFEKKFPEIEEELASLLKKSPAFAEFISAGGTAGDHPVAKGDKTMADDNKQVAELQKQITDLAKQVSELTKEREDLEKRATAAEDELKKNRDATDEVLKVGTQEIKKSVVGDATFAVLKQQQEEINKAKEDALIEKAKDKAEKTYANLPGDPLAKGKAFVAIEKMDPEVQQTLVAMLAAGDKAMADAIDPVGKSDDPNDKGSQGVEKKIIAKAREIEKRDSVTYAEAYTKALEENPDLYKDFLAEKDK